MPVGISLQFRDVSLGILFFSRLLLYILWDKIEFIQYKRQITTQIKVIFDSILSVYGTVSDVSCLVFYHWTTYFLGTSQVVLNMSDILNRKLTCGVGESESGYTRIRIDQACLTLNLSDYQNLTGYTVLSQSSECYQCPLQVIWSQEVYNVTRSSSIMVDTRYSTLLAVRDQNQNIVCSTTKHFEQFGEYQLSLEDCLTTEIQKPVNAFLPIFWSFVCLCMMAGLRLAYQSIYKTAIFRRMLVWCQLRSGSRVPETGLDGAETPLLEDLTVKTKTRRVKSLDTFRGLAITLMIFVNYGGGSYYMFSHSPWNGLTVADLVFPWFMWIMGVSLIISTQSQLRNSVPRKLLVLRVVKRSMILIFLGLILNTRKNNNLHSIRLPGVLQRFGISYLLVGVVESLLLPRQFPDQATSIMDLTTCPLQWLISLSCLIFHTLMTFYLPVPDCPTGYLGPGGLAENNSHPNCTGGAARLVDITIWGENHIYKRPSSHQLYGGVSYDPEGLLGTLTSVSLVWLGVVAGRIILVHKDWKARSVRWLVWSVICGLGAASLAGFSKNEGLIPINKNLWSISFILATGAMAFFILTVMYILVDVYKFWSGSPLYYPGMNSVLLYLGHEMAHGMVPWSWKPFTHSHAELMAMNMWGTALWIITSYVLFRKKIFLAL